MKRTIAENHPENHPSVSATADLSPAPTRTDCSYCWQNCYPNVVLKHANPDCDQPYIVIPLWMHLDIPPVTADPYRLLGVYRDEWSAHVAALADARTPNERARAVELLAGSIPRCRKASPTKLTPEERQTNRNLGKPAGGVK